MKTINISKLVIPVILILLCFTGHGGHGDGSSAAGNHGDGSSAAEKTDPENFVKNLNLIDEFEIKSRIIIDFKITNLNEGNSTYLLSIEADTYSREVLGKITGEYFRIYKIKNKTPELIYEKNFSGIMPWKVDSGDIDGDGISEIFIGAITETEYYPQAKRPFFFYWSGEYLIQKWTGSYIGFNELMDVGLMDTTNDGIDEVVISAKNDKGELNKEIYRWANFSFYRIK